MYLNELARKHYAALLVYKGEVGAVGETGATGAVGGVTVGYGGSRRDSNTTLSGCSIRVYAP